MLVIWIYISFICVITVISSNLIDLKNKSNNKTTSDLFLNSAIDCTSLITYKHIPCGSLIAFISTVAYMEPLHKLLSDKNCYKFIIRSFPRQEWLMWPNVNIISEKNFLQFNSTFNNLPKNTAWNPKAQFIILIYDLKRSEYDDVFKLLLKLNIFNIILLTKSENGNLKISTYDPFNKNGCGKSFEEVININNCTDVKNIRTNYKYFEGKYRNCTIIVSGREDVPHLIFSTNKEYNFLKNNTDGLEQYMLSNFAKQENITLEYIILEPGASYGVVLPNWTATGAFGYLQNNTASIAAGGYLLMLNRMKMFDAAWGHSSTTFLLFTPVLADTRWKKIYHQFNGSTWLLIALSYIFVTFVTILTGRYFMGQNNANRLALILWGQIFGNTNDKLLLVKKLRKMLIVWIWFTFFITSFYSTEFYTLLTTKSINMVTYANMKLESLPLKPCISDNTRCFFEYKFNETLPGKSNSQCNTVDKSLDTVANSHEFYGLENHYRYNIREFKYIDDEGNHKLERFQYTDNIMVTIYMTKGFPLQDKLQRYVRYHREAGLLRKQARLISHRYKMFAKHDISHSFKNISLGDLRIPYIILFLGYILSLISFIIEIKRSNKI